MTRAEKLLVSLLLVRGRDSRRWPSIRRGRALDPTFGQSGQATISIANESVAANHMVLQPDGKIITVTAVPQRGSGKPHGRAVPGEMNAPSIRRSTALRHEFVTGRSRACRVKAIGPHQGGREWTI